MNPKDIRDLQSDSDRTHILLKYTQNIPNGRSNDWPQNRPHYIQKSETILCNYCACVQLRTCVRLFVTPRTPRSLPGSSAHRFLQTRILEWVNNSSSNFSYTGIKMEINNKEEVEKSTYMRNLKNILPDNQWQRNHREINQYLETNAN